MSRVITEADGFPIAEFNGITVNKSLLSNAANYYSYSSRNVKYIVVHYTGNSSDTAKANANYFNTDSRSASAHYFVDNNSCYQSIALNNAAWAVGGTNVYKHSECRNLNSVSVEMCCCGNYAVSEQTENNAVRLCAELCRYLGIKSNEVDAYVLRHWDVWAKECPKGFTGNNNARWNGFKEKVKAALNGETEDLNMTQYEELKNRIDTMATNLTQIINDMDEKIEKVSNPIIYNYIDENMPASYRPTIQKLVDNKFLQGNEKGELMLTVDMMRILTILDRAGHF